MPIRVFCAPPADHAAQITDPWRSGCRCGLELATGMAERLGEARQSCLLAAGLAARASRLCMRAAGLARRMSARCARAGPAITGSAASAGLARFVPSAIASRRRGAATRHPGYFCRRGLAVPGRERDGRQRCRARGMMTSAGWGPGAAAGGSIPGQGDRNLVVASSSVPGQECQDLVDRRCRLPVWG